MKRVLFVLCLLGLCASAWANDGVYSLGVPGSAAPLNKHTTVRMVWERIYIKADWKSDKKGMFKVHCHFVFKNEGPATNVEMGFPEYNEDESEVKTQFTGFKSWVDGKPVKTQFVPGHRPEAQVDDNYVNWHTKNVHFNAGQTRNVVDEYEAPYQDETGIQYILRTGRDWKGKKIGESTVIIDTSAVSSFYKIANATPTKALRIQSGIATWRYRNFTPVEDIELWLGERHGVFINRWTDAEGEEAASDYTSHRVSIEDPETYAKDGIALTPASELAQELAGREFSAEEQSAWYSKSPVRTYKLGSRSLKIQVGSRIAKLNGRKTIYLERAPSREKNYGILVPVFSIAKALGCRVVKDRKHDCLLIKLPKGLEPKVVHED